MELLLVKVAVLEKHKTLLDKAPHEAVDLVHSEPVKVAPLSVNNAPEGANELEGFHPGHHMEKTGHLLGDVRLNWELVSHPEALSSRVIRQSQVKKKGGGEAYTCTGPGRS